MWQTRKPGQPDSDGDQTGDLDRGVRLAMAPASPHVLATTELLDDDLLGPELVDDLRDDLGAFDDRGPDRRARGPAREQQDLGEDDLIPRLAIAVIDVQMVPFANPELMTAVFDNRVHPSKLLIVLEPLAWVTPADVSNLA